MTHIPTILTPAILAALTLAACGQGEGTQAPAASEPVQQAAPAVNTVAPPAAPPATQPAPAAPAEEQASDDWRKYARPADVDRLGRLDAAWARALQQVKKEGDEAQFAALGALADPKVSLPRPHPAPGLYRCRTIKLGGLGLIAYPYFTCQVELTPGGDLILSKVNGSQRSSGLLYPGEGNRLVFLGAQAWGDTEAKAPEYGASPERDQIGVLDRIGEQRWRLAMPWPRVESDLDLMEIVK